MPITLSEEQYLSSARFAGFVEEAASRRDRERPLIYDAMVPKVEAEEGEIFLTYSGHVTAADIIADDAEATVDDGGRFTTTTNEVANLKHGRRFGQAQLERLERLRRAGGATLPADERYFANYRDKAVLELVEGIRVRRNIICCQMMRDTMVYDRYGVKLSGSYGKPADLKGTAAVDWSTHATATPITDILTLKGTAATQYGETYDEIIMSTAAFTHLVQSAEFQDQLRSVLQWQAPVDAFNPLDRQRITPLLAQLLGMQVILDDARYNYRSLDGTRVTERYLPLTEVILSSAANRNNSSVWDFACTTPTELKVARAAAREGLSYGVSGLVNVADNPTQPLGYITVSEDLNAPGITYWAVQRGFTRCHNKYATATLDTGAYVA